MKVETPMPIVELLAPDGHRRIPWKNGRGELVVIDGEGGQTWENMGVAWHFGRTAIAEAGPFSDYSGYERLQVVIKGAGLVLVAPDHEVDLRHRMQVRRYDGGTPIRTQLEQGPVEVVNLIADRARFEIELRVGDAGGEIVCEHGRHVVYAPNGAACIAVDGHAYTLAQDHGLRVRTTARTSLDLQTGQVLVGSIRPRP